MTKHLKLKVIIIFMGLTLIACSPRANKENKDQNTKTPVVDLTEEGIIEPVYDLTEEGIIETEDAKKIISEISSQVIEAISSKNIEVLANYVHPVKGVRFTPYPNVSVEHDIIMSQEKIKSFFDDQTVYQWGYYDGSGFEISLTPSQYYDEFIYTSDFVNAERIGYNKILRTGNIVENQFEIYDKAIIVEYYFSGFDPDYGGADWQSLRLVFEFYENQWRLVGLIHNQMTM